ncbi:MAG: GSU2403 family nucleotidyltransferase fold protein [Candidatus Eremiobacteraeota bacterium]|nr:GSU2403 family nucleotidyltransferase fold protein [Candidatus Eremiobacteraeota bacterium]
MEEKIRFVDRILKALSEEGLLEHFLVVGSWCIYFYKHMFKDSLKAPLWKTTDIEFDTSSLKKAPKTVDISRFLRDFGFLVRYHGDEGYTTYEHPELIIEFFVPQVGDGRTNPYKIPGFGINPQPMRFLSMLEDEALTIDYNGLPIRVPRPANYSIHKLMISTERKNPTKAEKDRQQALALWDMLRDSGEEDALKAVFSKLSSRQQKLARKSLEILGESGRLQGFTLR